jgi:ComF family protein
LPAGLIDSCFAALRRVMPPACLLCGDRARESGLCAGCERAVPRLDSARCPICAAPAPAGQVCGRCLKSPPRFDRVVAALAYAHPVDSLVQALKYDGSLASARPLAWALAYALEPEPYPDLVLAMPLAPSRLAARGFNQAAEIARLVCREFGIAAANDVVQRVRPGVPQASLPWKERARNVRGAFLCSSDLARRRVAVVDDVLTTGATLDALAAELKRCGAIEVVGWIAARTL